MGTEVVNVFVRFVLNTLETVAILIQFSRFRPSLKRRWCAHGITTPRTHCGSSKNTKITFFILLGELQGVIALRRVAKHMIFH